MTKVTGTPRRKADHIRINLEEDVQSPRRTTGLERYAFIHQALPELDLSAVDLSTTFLGKRLAAPLLISSMTGGVDEAQTLNLRLASMAQAHGIAMGVGSQRAAIEQPDLAATYQVRHVAPDIFLMANLGAIQLNYGYGVDECRRAVEMIEADTLILHLNVLQEAIQSEGDTNWSGLLSKIEQVCRDLPVPVIAKEVGWGLSEQSARQLAEAGVTALDVAGAGGSSWSEVEYHRAPTAFHAQVARAFVDWGLSTADSILAAKRGAPDSPIIASGGLRDGIDVAKCIALGASLGGMAGPFLRAADHCEEAVDEIIRIVTTQLRVAMLCAGIGSIDALKIAPLQRIE